ncbi:MAG TPA: VanZ family protein [Vicinamibacterales bacterium]|nr:VanZ family protein [Vicinamibacterales bacterium]
MTRLWLWGPAVVQMAIIFMASSIPNLSALPGGMSDKTGHGIGYAILGALVLRALARGRWRGVTWRAVLLTILIATVYGITDEFHQAFVPGRTPDVHDVVADATGAALAACAAGLWGILDTGRKRPSADRDHDV